MVVVILPLGVVLALLLLHRAVRDGAGRARGGAAQACEAPLLRRHAVIVLVDRLDMAVARAIQYARSLTPDDLRVVHFDVDNKVARELEEQWSALGLSRLPLDIIECPDRRLGRASIELVADAVYDDDTECTVLLPRREFGSAWERFLHDRTADKIAALVGQVPHVAATIIPFTLRGRWAAGASVPSCDRPRHRGPRQAPPRRALPARTVPRWNRSNRTPRTRAAATAERRSTTSP